MSQLTVTLPDGSRQQVPAGTSPMDRSSAGGGGFGTVSGDEARRGTAGGERLLLRLRAATPFTPDDLEKIEQRMWELQKKDLPYGRILTQKDDGLEKYKDDWMKCEFITERLVMCSPSTRWGPTSWTSAGARMCRPRSRIKAFKLTSVAGAHWKGNLDKPLQRIYGTAWFSNKDLRHTSRASKKRRSATTASWARNWTCSAFRNSPVPGLIFFHPKGGRSARFSKTGCAINTWRGATRWCTRRT
jgi:hypothetical protein